MKGSGKKNKSKPGRVKGSRRKTTLAFVAFALISALMLGGCGGAASGSASSDMAVAEETMAAVAMPSQKSSGSGAAVSGGAILAGAEAVGITGGAEAAGGEAAPGETIAGEETGQPGDTEEPTSGRKLIRTIDLNLQTQDMDGLLSTIDQRVSELGGYIESSWQSGAEGYTNSRSADIRVRMPAERTDEFLETALTGAVVTYRSESTEDVTLRYTDMEARMEALRIEQERLMELLAEAESIDSVIAIESRLSDVRYEIESIGSQLRSYDDLVTFDTITISIAEVKVIESGGEASFSDRVRTGFAKNLTELSKGLEDLLILFIINLPLILILAVFAVLIYIIVKMTGRRRKAKRQQKENSAGRTEPESERKDEVTTHADDKGGKA